MGFLHWWEHNYLVYGAGPGSEAPEVSSDDSGSLIGERVNSSSDNVEHAADRCPRKHTQCGRVVHTRRMLCQAMLAFGYFIRRTTRNMLYIFS